MHPAIRSTVNPIEISHFTALSSNWWSPNGTSRLLHKLNPLRVQYLRSHITDFTGKKALDVGCGGGIFSESLARLGCNVTGLDATIAALKVAKEHAERNRIKVDYRNEEVGRLQGTWDIVLASEVIEHVSSPKLFLQHCKDRVAPGGYLFFSTINRTYLSWLLTILMGENILGLVPKGTHTWSQYIKPNELGEAIGWETSVQGIGYNPLKGKWEFIATTDCNYFVIAKRPIMA